MDIKHVHLPLQISQMPDLFTHCIIFTRKIKILECVFLKNYWLGNRL